MTKIVTVKCPFCSSENVGKNGHNTTGKQVYLYKKSKGKHFSFVEKYTYKAYNPQVREQVLKMVVDCTETRATGRILGIAQNTVTTILKKHKTGHGK
ncbi:MAG: IS1-like element transposase [Candidatus Bathyarchaeota archaeon]|nr:IS1-like element transposase [Candidatus Termiticorpusculum sp.]MCL1971138.1 IS1-like element transposase [Candidatus Termiticorpusculum sp.]